MLEIFDKIKDKDFNIQYRLLKETCIKQPHLPELLKIYVNDKNKVITPTKILKMMRFFKVEKSRNIDKIGEIGNYAAIRTQLLKRREFGWKKDTNHLILHMQNISFLISVYKELQINISHKKQYLLLKNCFVMISSTDIKWFVRLLCKMVKVNKAILEVIKDEKI